MTRFWPTPTLRAILAALFLLGLGLQTWTGWIAFKAHQQTHGEPGNALGPNGYVWPWGAALSQLVAFAALAGLLAGQASRTRADDAGELRQTLRRLEGQLAELSRLQEAAVDRQIAPVGGSAPPAGAPGSRSSAPPAGSG